MPGFSTESCLVLGPRTDSLPVVLPYRMHTGNVVHEGVYAECAMQRCLCNSKNGPSDVNQASQLLHVEGKVPCTEPPTYLDKLSQTRTFTCILRLGRPND
jgi:hypothetical protein